MGETTQSASGKLAIPDARWLVVGAVAGLLAAAFGILRQADAGRDLPDGTLARVNDRLITRGNYERAVARLQRESGTDDDPAWVLQRLIDDELLVQRALELGMAQTDIAVRTAIINSLIASVTAEADAASPADAELQQYLADNADRFTFVERVAVEAWQSDDEEAAQSFLGALRDNGNATESGAVVPVPGLPSGLVPIEQLRDSLGPGIAAAAADMPPGSSAVFARRGRWLVVRVLDKASAAVTDLGRIRNSVLLDYRRNLAERTLRGYLDDLRRRATVVVTQP